MPYNYYSGGLWPNESKNGLFPSSCRDFATITSSPIGGFTKRAQIHVL